jgi:primosomal protein N'
MVCSSCGYGLNNMATEALCRRCGHKEPLPPACPQCHGADLNRSVIGTDLLQQQIGRHFPGADVKVVDPQTWPTQSLPPHSLVVVTNLNFIGGYTEDIRRKERMVIAFRRLAAQISLAQCRLIAQGSEILTNECLTWLAPDGLQKAWSKELTDRRQFDYPPTHSLIKLIVTAKPDETDPVTVQIHTTLGETGWEIRGPYKVENRAENRDPRMVYHLLPPPALTRDQSVDALTPLASLGILDLDPIAFFS